MLKRPLRSRATAIHALIYALQTVDEELKARREAWLATGDGKEWSARRALGNP